MRIFFSTGEASGEQLAILLGTAMARRRQGLTLEGIGSARMRSAGFALWWDTRGWASLGPLAALGKIPRLLAIMWTTALRLKLQPPGLVILIDFGAFNIRLAKTLRLLRYRGEILYFFPPGAWLDNAGQARRVAEWTRPLTAFEHQHEFYRSLGLPSAFFGHPLLAEFAPRAPRPPAAIEGGVVAVLPGSRAGEIARHAPLLFEAASLVRRIRPNLEIIVGAADAASDARLRRIAARYDFPVTFANGARAALAGADAAWIASGTAVLEAALLGVPCVALYVLSQAQANIARRVYHGRFITLPNLILGRPVVAELLQDAATPPALAAAIEVVLQAPQAQLADFAALRRALGADDALERCAAYALDLVAAA